MIPHSCLEVPTNSESFERRTTAIIPFLDDWNSAGKLVDRLKSLFWSLTKREGVKCIFHTLEVKNPLGFITLVLQRPGTGNSDLCSAYSHLISVWFRNYF